MAVSQQVQTVLDKVTQTQSLAQSLEAASQAQGQLISQLQAQIAALQPGQSLSQDDINALTTTANDLDAINAESG